MYVTNTRTHAPTPTRKKKGTHAHLIFETPSHTFFLSFFFERRTPQISSSPASPVFSAHNLVEQIPISANAARRGFPSARPTTVRPASRLLYRRNAGGPADPPTAATHFGRVPCRQRFGLFSGAWNGRRQNNLTRAICADYAERCRAALPAHGQQSRQQPLCSRLCGSLLAAKLRSDSRAGSCAVGSSRIRRHCCR